MYVRNYLNGIHEIQDKMPCIALTPFKHKNGRANNKGTLLPLCKMKFKACSLATTRTKPAMRQNPFRRKRFTNRKPKPTDILDVPLPTS
jgi:hypothetical protein